MEVGDDVLSHEATRLSGADTILRPIEGERYAAGPATYMREPGTGRIVEVDSAGGCLAIDYPLAVDSGLFELPP